jgi:Lrp/AsnC family transcriptional regulator, leucine-responsive regulatory protein
MAAAMTKQGSNMYELDDIDLKILRLWQVDTTLSNQALAAKVPISPPTCLRRLKRLREAGYIEREVAILNSDKLANHAGHGLVAITEVTLDVQNTDKLAAFEAKACQMLEVQQCYRTSPGPDFVLVIHCTDMPAYLALSQTLLTADANVRNVKTFFSVKRAKYSTAVPL